MGVILAIDPGPLRSAWVAMGYVVPFRFGIVPNDQLLDDLRGMSTGYEAVVIEKVESFGMAVGVEVFETVFWAGRMAEAAQPLSVHMLGRKAVKLHLCHSMRAKDSNIRQALIDRFGGPSAIGKKATPGPLYGIAGDVWSALAIAVTWSDMNEGRE